MIANWLIGVLLATLASIVSNLGLNLQKLNHTLNEQRIRASNRRKRRASEDAKNTAAAVAAAAAAAGDLPAHAAYAGTDLTRHHAATTEFGVTGTKIMHDHHAAAVAAAAAAAASSDQADEEAGRLSAHSYQHSPTPAAIHPLLMRNSSEPCVQTSALTPSQQRHLAAYAQLNAIDYSKQGLWRGGLALVTLGSLLDFTALMFAAQSIVAPLGSLTLVSNTVFAPLLLGESISRRDLLATAAIVCGACMAIVGADHTGAVLPIDQLFDCFLTERFMLYALVVSVALIALFYTKVWCTHIQLTDPRRYTKESLAGLHRFTYASLAGIMGAQSVLFAKCTGEILMNVLGAQSRSLDHDADDGKSPLTHYWQTYFVLLSLCLSIFFQISWLNSGLKHFEALYIVPVFQSFWILVSVVAGMVFFGEYKAIFRTTASALMFPAGVLVTIAGVYVLSQRGGTHAAARNQATPQQRDYRHYRPVSIVGGIQSQSSDEEWSSSAASSAPASASEHSVSPSPNATTATAPLTRATSSGTSGSSSMGMGIGIGRSTSASQAQAGRPFVSPSGVLAPLSSYQSLDAASSAALLAHSDADGDDDDDDDAASAAASLDRVRSWVSPAPPMAFLSAAFLDQTVLSSSWKEEAPIAREARSAEAAAATASSAASKPSSEDGSRSSSARAPRSDALSAAESSPLLIAAKQQAASAAQ